MVQYITPFALTIVFWMKSRCNIWTSSSDLQTCTHIPEHYIPAKVPLQWLGLSVCKNSWKPIRLKGGECIKLNSCLVKAQLIKTMVPRRVGLLNLKLLEISTILCNARWQHHNWALWHCRYGNCCQNSIWVMILYSDKHAYIGISFCAQIAPGLIHYIK